MKNGIGLGTVAGVPESSREGEGGISKIVCTLNVDPCPSPSGSVLSVQVVMLLWGREDSWEVAVALQRKGRLLREREESWSEIV